MSFFTKLRERLTGSSSKIGAGLDGIVEAAPEAAAPAPAPSGGLVGRLFGTTPARPEEPRRALDDGMLEELEDMLVQADLGVDTALRITANIAEGRMGRRMSSTELRELLAAEIARITWPSPSRSIADSRCSRSLRVAQSGAGSARDAARAASKRA